VLLRRNNAPNLLFVAYIHIILELLLRTQVSVYALLDQYGLYRGVTEDDTSSEEAVDHGKEDLYCEVLAVIGWAIEGLYVHMRFHLGTSNAPTVAASSPVCSVHVPTGLNDILRCRESGLASLLHGSISSTAVRRCDKDMLRLFPSQAYPDDYVSPNFATKRFGVFGISCRDADQNDVGARFNQPKQLKTALRLRQTQSN
jgi:hypothetical protein